MLAALFTRLMAATPSQCLVCQRWPSRVMCDDCVAQFAQPLHRCLTCALPLPADSPRCGQCLTNPPPLDSCLAALPYAYPWSGLIADFKFHQQPGLARQLAHLLLATPWVEPALDAADLVLPMPLSPQRLRERGYNQALLLAHHLQPGKTRADVLLRIQDTPAQHTLKRSARLGAQDHAFAIEPVHAASLQQRRVVLVDDVMTTGATLFAAARVLRQAGVAHLSAVVLARTE